MRPFFLKGILALFVFLASQSICRCRNFIVLPDPMFYGKVEWD